MLKPSSKYSKHIIIPSVEATRQMTSSITHKYVLLHLFLCILVFFAIFRWVLMSHVIPAAAAQEILDFNKI